MRGGVMSGCGVVGVMIVCVMRGCVMRVCYERGCDERRCYERGCDEGVL